MTSCASHCGGLCGLKVYVKDGVITKIEADDSDEPQWTPNRRVIPTGLTSAVRRE
jgi:anaerobic selenocysteine-containing dehydrogenase